MKDKIYDFVYGEISRQVTKDILDNKDTQRKMIRLEKLYNAITLFDDEDFIDDNIIVYHNEVSTLCYDLVFDKMKGMWLDESFIDMVYNAYLFDKFLPICKSLTFEYDLNKR